MSELYLLDATGLELPADATTRFLSIHEQARVSEFCAERRRREFLIGRLLLKATLTKFSPLRIGEFPSISPIIADNGKPALPGFEFNLSHAGEVFLLALGGAEVGVDIEPVQFFDEATAALCFGPNQRDKIACSFHPDRVATLLWCLCEADGKLRGTGLRQSNDDIVAPNRNHRRGGFLTVGGKLHAWALSSPMPRPRTPWIMHRPSIQSLLQSLAR